MGGLGAGVRQGKLKLGVVCAKPAKIVGLLGDRFPPTFYNVSPVSISTSLLFVLRLVPYFREANIINPVSVSH